MVLPGIQALFGFQLTAVFNPTFAEKLGTVQQRLHLFSIGLVVIAIALIMTPAAYHRQISPRAVSVQPLAVLTRLLIPSMAPLALAICLDFYLVAWLIGAHAAAAVLAATLFVGFQYLWFLFPRVVRTKRLMG